MDNGKVDEVFAELRAEVAIALPRHVGATPTWNVMFEAADDSAPDERDRIRGYGAEEIRQGLWLLRTELDVIAPLDRTIPAGTIIFFVSALGQKRPYTTTRTATGLA